MVSSPPPLKFCGLELLMNVNVLSVSKSPRNIGQQTSRWSIYHTNAVENNFCGIIFIFTSPTFFYMWREFQFSYRKWCCKIHDGMMTPWKENTFRVTGHLCGEFHWSPVNFHCKGQWRGALMFSLICTWINGRANNRETGDLRCHRAHYDVTVMGCDHKYLRE